MEKYQEYYNNLIPEIRKYFNILANEIPTFLISYIETNTMLRLKDISYFCAMEYGNKDYYNFKYYISRLDHSISTALIVWNFSQDKKQTIAALFHDARTPATSHVIDYLNEDYIIQESTEDGLKETLIKDNELIHLLNKDGYKIDEIIDFKKYSLLDCKRPKLCADRIDGIFLTSLAWSKNIDLNEIKDIYNDLTLIKNENNNIEYSFNNVKYVDKFIELNNKINELTNSIMDYNSMAICANLISYLINKKIITYNDLYILTDHLLFNIIDNYTKVDKYFNQLYNNFKLLKDIETDIPKLKQREIDPLILKKRYSKINHN
ncbi:MAG: hypothetical protein PHS24_03040 [Bacilli bacterium]|nr:hypothetical protein [Bacilli bacterium]